MPQTRVIIAEDEAIPRLDLREMLDNLGYLVVGEASDGRSAVNLARELRPDLVIMDIKMPDMDGITAAKILTEERIAPVLLVTAYSDRELVERAKDSGVLAYVAKPFGEAQLVPAIEVALARFRELRALERELGDTKQALETRKLVERAKGVLMDTQGLKEAEAFRKIQKLSMNTRKSMREVAEAILLAHEVQKDVS
ncbi:MAG TPA: response regulator [Chloroflexota bacterium]